MPRTQCQYKYDIVSACRGHLSFIRCILQQQLRNFGVSPICGHLERGTATWFLDVHVRSVLEQKSRNLEFSPERCNAQRSSSIGYGVDVGTVFQEDLRNVDVSPH